MQIKELLKRVRKFLIEDPLCWCRIVTNDITSYTKYLDIDKYLNEHTNS